MLYVYEIVYERPPMNDLGKNIIFRTLVTFVINIYFAQARGAHSNRGGSSGARIGFSSFQEPTTSTRSHFQKYIAGASIAFIAGQGLRPYYFSSSTHRYQKAWLVSIFKYN